MFRKVSQVSSLFNRMLPLAGLLAAGLCIPAAVAQSVPYPTYAVGEQADGSWVTSNGAIITPAGKQVNLGYAVRAKAVAVNPTGNHTAAVLVMGASQAAVEVIDTKTATVIQNYIALGTDSNGSYTGITYTPDGKWLLFSQDDNYSAAGSHVAIAMVGAQGLLQDFVQVSVPLDATNVTLPGYGTVQKLNTVTCYPQSAYGTTGSSPIPCGIPYGQNVSYPAGIAITSDSKTAYVVLDANNTLAKIDLTAKTPNEITDIRVGNLPHSVVISADGKTAYVSNEGGRIATASDKYQLYSDGTPVVADPKTGSLLAGTISVVDLASFKVTGSIPTGLHRPAWPGGAITCWSPTPTTTRSRSSIPPPRPSPTRSTSACRSRFPVRQRLPSAPARTPSPSTPRTTSSMSLFTTPTRSRWSIRPRASTTRSRA